PTTSRVQRALFRASRQAWEISAGADRKMPGAVGDAARPTLLDRPADWYLARVQRRVASDPAVGSAFHPVVSLTRPLTALFAPRVARAVLFGPRPRSIGRPPLWREPGEG
ncbi:monooxygenase, partial [Streptomyces sp. Act-28]